MPDTIPQDWRDLLIRLDQKVGDGFEAMNKRFDAYDRRADALERRVGDLETMLADRPLYIAQHSALMSKVAALETAHVRVDAIAKTLWFMVGGGALTVLGTIGGFLKAFHAI